MLGLRRFLLVSVVMVVRLPLDPIAACFCSNGYMCTIHPKTCGTNLPPAASQSSLVEIEPVSPKLVCGPPQFPLPIWRRHAQIHVGVPLGNTERDSLVKLIFAGIFGRGIHDTDQLVVVPVFLVEQRCRMLGPSTERGFQRVPGVRNAIFTLLQAAH